MGKLRLGIIFTVTGIIVLLVHFLEPGGTGRISPDAQLLVGIVLVVVGIPFLITGTRHR